jgi:hypothetical protein
MEDSSKDRLDNPMHHPEEPSADTDDSPRFGRLLIILVLAVMLIGIITVASETYFSR